MTRITIAAIVLGAALVASITLAVMVGSADIGAADVWGSVIAHLTGRPSPLDPLHDGIVWQLRLPRVLTAAGRRLSSTRHSSSTSPWWA